ncbi:MAG TPA: YgdI/YgdR family lipoprotein [Candidatus Binatia bacterium]|jgi:hypothetical protein|nr:YgdI/YgdR family lipoprotein [Candidatus Binatia bacterium]
MRKMVLPLVLSLLVLCGCAHQYVMKLNNGSTITTASKPRLKHGTYVFKDALGHDNFVPRGRVVEIEPASMATQEKQFQVSNPTPKKHWYWPF